MKIRTVVAMGILIFNFILFEQSKTQTIPDGPYLGQPLPGVVPEIFAPGLISLPNRRDTKVVFSPDGNECFIGTVVSRTFTLLYTKQENGHWTEPITANFLGTADKREPFISPDGNALFFARNADIWVSKRENQDWGKPSRLGTPISTSAEEWHPTATIDGTLYFCSTRDSDYFIYRSKWIDGEYSVAEKLNQTINTIYGAWDPFISPNEDYMVFSSSWPDGFGKVDQYISYYNKQDDTWTTPRNLGSIINTDEIEYGSYISSDNKYYFFSRPKGWGATVDADIYWVNADVIFNTSRIDDNQIYPKLFQLYQNFPNPFNPTTTITYQLQRPEFVTIKILNASGQEIETLTSDYQAAGKHTIAWRPDNLSSSIYFCRLETDNNSETLKLILKK